MAPLAVTPQNTSPSKDFLREEVRQGEQALQQVRMQAEHFQAQSTQHCYSVLENQQHAFEQTCRKYEAEAHDAAALEVAEASLAANSQHGSVMEVAERRAVMRMQASNQALQAEAERVIQQDRSAMHAQSEQSARLMEVQLKHGLEIFREQ